MDPLEQQQLTQSGSPLGTFWHRCRSDLVTQILRDAQTRRVLDVGAGAGHLGTWIEQHAPEIRYAFRETNPRLADALEQRFSPEQNLSAGALDDIDAVVLLDVIEHVEDDRAFVASLVDELPPGGLVVATVPALPLLFSGWDDAMGHFRRYTRRSLASVLRGLPVWVAECSYLFPELLPAAVARRITKPPATETSPEFPELPPMVDEVLFRACRTSARCRRVMPAGTSLLVVATKLSGSR